MSHVIAELLTSDHPMLVRTIADFEKASGSAGIDTRLIADITEKAHEVMRNLRIDPADTPGEELYHALNAAVQNGQVESLLSSTGYVLLRSDDGPISFNLQDVVENAHHQLPYAERVIGHGQRHLRAEIVRRYAEHDRTDGDMIHNLAEMAGLKPEADTHHQDAAIEPDTAGGDKPSVLMIGDVFTDAFIKLNEDSTKIIKESDGREWLALPFGQKPPYDQVDIVRSVGPSPNAAVSAARLGLNSSLMAWVGSDDVGREAIDHLKTEHVATSSMVVENDKQTSYWYVLRYGADRTMLVKSEKYEYDWTAPADMPDWIYLSYIGADSWPLHEALLDYLSENPNTKLAFQPGTFHFKWGVDKLRGVYGRSHIVVMNREEAVDVTGRPYESLKGLAEGLHELGPKTVVITDGAKGSYASFEGRLVTIPNYPDPADPLDRTGAGDAFASTIVSALALGESMETALTWAPINSMNVVQHLGAQAGLLGREDVVKYLNEAPQDYKVTDFSG
jgi:ribokinase